MRAALGRLWDQFVGSGEAAVTLPPLDGALRPNQEIEQADLVAEAPSADNLARDGDRTVLSSEATLLALRPGGGTEPVHGFGQAITALAGAPDGGLAVGLADGTIVLRGGSRGGRSLALPPELGRFGPTALLFDGTDTLLACTGSARNPPGEWKRDLMGREAAGAVLRIDLNGSAPPQVLASGLAYPNGLALDQAGLVVAESWRHRLVRLDAGGKRSTVLDDLPGYPARLAPAADGRGAWLAVFAPRSQLIEFILREPSYRNRMMREVDPRYWMSPALSAPRSFLEPLQGGAIKQLGMMKPWAPSRSYGLVVRLDAGFQPVASLHSRADGQRHGITSCLDTGNALLLTSRGSDTVLAAVTAGGHA